MRTKLLIAVAVVALLAGTLLLAGCPKQQATELQGAPPAEQHQMPGGKMMGDEQMKPPPAATTGEQKPAQAPAAATGTPEMTSCPVLGTTMAKKDMLSYEYKGKTYYFCCQDCIEQFKKDPEKWIKHPTPPKPAGEGMSMPK